MWSLHLPLELARTAVSSLQRWCFVRRHRDRTLLEVLLYGRSNDIYWGLPIVAEMRVQAHVLVVALLALVIIMMVVVSAAPAASSSNCGGGGG